VKRVWVQFLKSLFSVSALILSCSLAWLLLFSVNFLYPIWHDHGGIAQGIEKFGPKNRFKVGFEDTSHEQRYRIFAQINDAVHSGGDGLNAIHYQSVSSNGPQLLLREAEVIHLQDVARLIDRLYWLAGFNLLLWGGLLFTLRRVQVRTLSWRGQAISLLSIAAAIALILVSFGPETVFNQLHIWIFPKDHEWFFYYQDSLMSTMMLAPLLFAWIAGALGLLSCLMFAGIVLLARKLLVFGHKKAGI
jgi:uncharacterized membrane protein